MIGKTRPGFAKRSRDIKKPMFESLYQSFAHTADPAKSAARLAALRKELARRGLSGFLVPRADRHQGEFVPPS
jgi:Xaa-Pro aminopeptidase